MKVDTVKSEASALEGSSMPINEFKKAIDIEQAEKGSFYSPLQAKKLLAKWRKKKDSL
jgi:hypothetical protein